MEPTRTRDPAPCYEPCAEGSCLRLACRIHDAARLDAMEFGAPIQRQQRVHERYIAALEKVATACGAGSAVFLSPSNLAAVERQAQKYRALFGPAGGRPR